VGIVELLVGALVVLGVVLVDRYMARKSREKAEVRHQG